MTRRDWVRRAAGGVGVWAGGCRRNAPHRIGEPGDGEATPSAVDYATARKGFRTTLNRQGPAPEKGDMPRAVAGAVPFPYSSGGFQLVGWVNPEARVASTRRPAVLFLHGGFAFGADHWEYARPFLRAGFHVLLPVLRAENQQPGCFSLFYDEVDDCLAAADALSRLPGVDPGRLFLCGHAAGGTLALLTALTTDRFRACSTFSPSPSAAGVPPRPGPAGPVRPQRGRGVPHALAAGVRVVLPLPGAVVLRQVGSGRRPRARV